LLFNLSRPRRLIELSNLAQTASRTLAENTRSIASGDFAKAREAAVTNVAEVFFKMQEASSRA